jgi:hypothetical protein
MLGESELDFSLIVARASGSLESTQSREPGLPRSEDGSSLKQPPGHSSDTADLLAAVDLPEDAIKPNTRPTRSATATGRKKVGRPIEYEGDPDSPLLSEQERRRIKRRISNRESARRVRHKRQEVVDEMQATMDKLKEHNSKLQTRAQKSDYEKQQLAKQLSSLEGKYEQMSAENSRMAMEVHGLRQTLQMKMTALEDELDKRVNEATGVQPPPRPSAFAASAAEVSLPLPLSAPLSEPSLDVRGAVDWLPTLLEDVPPAAGSLEMLDNLLYEEGGGRLPTSSAAVADYN